MEKALNKKDEVVYADAAQIDGQYFCPCCGTPVLLKRGKVYTPHFAHISLDNCDSRYHNNLGEWHTKMQDIFPREWREVIIGNRIADIFHKNCVVEFQHSPITHSELRDRTNDYLTRGIKYVVWVFDERKTKGIEVYDEYIRKGRRCFKIRWKHRKYYLRGADLDNQRCRYVLQIDEDCFIRLRYNYDDQKLIGGTLERDIPMQLFNYLNS